MRGIPAKLAFLVGLLAFAGTAAAQTGLERRLRLEDLPPSMRGTLPVPTDQIRTPSPVTDALAGPIDPTTYRLGPGDLLVLEYTGRADESTQIEVDGEGRARFPNLGTIKVAGRLLQEVREQVVRDLKSYVPGARVDLRLLSPRHFKVFVVGAVEEQGVVTVRGSARVLEALDAAGGLAENASTRNIRVLHGDGREEIADLQRFLWTGDQVANPLLEDGDRLVVPVATAWIFVSGALARPGLLEYKSGDRLSEVIRVAGGPLTEARLDSVLIVRFRDERLLDTLVVDHREGENYADPPIHEDDRVFVRAVAEWHPWRQVTLRGEVLFPGVYVIEEGDSRLSDLLHWGGGFTDEASKKAVRVLRRPDIEGEDVEFDRLSRLSRLEMTDTEYQQFRGKLAIRQSAYLVDFSSGEADPPETDVFLRDGDIVEVERLELSVRVDGSVLRPGFVSYMPGLTVQDYIQQAGGTSKRADKGGIRLTRAGTNISQRAKGDWVVEPGDFVWVPEKKDTSFWNTFKDVIAVAGQTAAIVLLFDQLTRE